jgi:hypothetical protein
MEHTHSFPQLTMLGVERHPTGRPDTEKAQDFMGSIIRVLLEDGNILRSKNEMFLSHDRDSTIVQLLGTRQKFRNDVLLESGNDGSGLL